MELAGYIAAMIMGLTLGLIGGGGSILTVPILVYLFQLSAVTATGYSLFVVGLTSLVGAAGYARRELLDYKTGAIFAAPAFIGVYLSRRFLMPALPSEIFQIGDFVLTKDRLILATFAVIMVLAAISMIRKKRSSTAQQVQTSPAKRLALIAAEGLVVGSVTGFVGAGGGFLIVPALVLLVGLDMKIAIGTSLGIIAVKSLFGFIGDVQTNTDIDWSFLLYFSSIAIAGILIGQKLSHKIPSENLKAGFGYFVLIMGSLILFL